MYVRTLPFAIPPIPNHPRGLMLPVLLRLDASSFDGYRDNITRYGLALTHSLATRLAEEDWGGSDNSRPASCCAVSLHCRRAYVMSPLRSTSAH